MELAYRECLQRVNIYGPTHFAPIIRQGMFISKNASKEVYHILMILTDGQKNDMEDIIDALVDASLLTISILSVGIGHGEFETMELLDAEVNPLRSRNGVFAARNCVEFVEFS